MFPIFAAMRLPAFLIFCLPVFLFAQNKEPITINSAEYLAFDKNFANAERLVGHVSMSQGDMTLTCDSAWFWKDENRMEAFGQAFLNQAGGVKVWSDYMLYNGNTKMASANRNVRLTDGKMSLTTDAIQYDVSNKIAYYTTGGNIKDGENTMVSRSGSYHSKSREYFFKGKIKLVNPEYTMESDTLNYNGNTKVAYFFGPTYITSTDNLLFCNYGWYNTEKNTCQFSKKAYILSKENRIDSDSFLYNRTTGIGRAFGNIKLTDTIQKIVIKGSKGIHNRFEKTTLISGNPVAFKEFEDDSIFIKADNFFDKLDTANDKRTLAAYGSSRIYKPDIQGMGDSLSYSLTDSTIRLFKDPVLWNEANQTTGDTIFIYQKGKTIDKMDVIQNAMVIMEEAPEKYNQIRGKKLYGLFANNKLYRVNVRGNGQSVYYAAEDSAKYTGVNYVECTNMVINIDSNKVKKVTFLVSPKGTFYPLDKFPKEREKLRGFRWLADKRPARKDFVF
ncbi:MAG: OstA-like protein [Bacteroidia bacterium]